MLQSAIEAEVDDFIAGHAQRTGAQTVPLTIVLGCPRIYRTNVARPRPGRTEIERTVPQITSRVFSRQAGLR